MTLSINTDTLRRELAFLAIAVEKDTTIPILANVLLETDGKGTLTLKTTDLGLYCSAGIPCDFMAHFKECIPFDMLSAFVEHELSDTISISVNGKEHKATIKSGTRQLTVGIHNVNNWPTFPVAPDKVAIVLGANDFLDVTKRASFAISKEESRYILNGALFETKGRVQMVATDGHRLTLVKGESINGNGVRGSCQAVCCAILARY